MSCVHTCCVSGRAHRMASAAKELRATQVRAYDDRAQALLQGTPMFQHHALSSYAITCALSNAGGGTSDAARDLSLSDVMCMYIYIYIYTYIYIYIYYIYIYIYQV